ncbi:hypothetical protein RAJCM14343_2582 [Rhodococcus aetherivorans]|uniref:Uncharacterized protein n=1 Tax=Rhodococcus aetherivorans TaxID=191292 RepID=A0ABQ0YLC7_9NOCA|nr:hypothetical protein RAJCM14343_2582 [Rhodococcus aetherivorans]
MRQHQRVQLTRSRLRRGERCRGITRVASTRTAPSRPRRP